MNKEEMERRTEVGREARMENSEPCYLYHRIWNMLAAEGLTGGADRDTAMARDAELKRISENQARKERRKERKRRKQARR
jgi:hypothetical protein